MDSVMKVKDFSVGCGVMAVKKALSSLNGIKDVSVDLEKGEVTLIHETPLDMDDARQRIEKAGYEIG
ncbi:MAG: heavy-metal-associated domain-containing protein [Deltaproteobacteria bacterium]|nr:heavy-metal-associated domain-containing protein [Deltaproteobacteria bacterium]